MPAEVVALLAYACWRVLPRGWATRLLLIGWTTAGVTAWAEWGHRVRLQYEMCRAERTCAAIVQSPDSVVYDGDPARSGALVRPGGDFRALSVLSIHSPSSVPPSAVSVVPDRAAKPFSEALEALRRWDARDLPPVETDVAVLLESLSDGQDLLEENFLIFTHARSASAGGPERILQIRGVPARGRSMHFKAVVWSRGGWFGRPKVVRQIRWPDDIEGEVVRAPRVEGGVRVFAPQPDPVDASRVTILYEAGERRRTVEARLTPADDVEFRVLPHPEDKPRR